MSGAELSSWQAPTDGTWSDMFSSSTGSQGLLSLPGAYVTLHHSRPLGGTLVMFRPGAQSLTTGRCLPGVSGPQRAHPLRGRGVGTFALGTLCWQESCPSKLCAAGQRRRGYGRCPDLGQPRGGAALPASPTLALFPPFTNYDPGEVPTGANIRRGRS